jgi:hypothetical protein
MRLATYSIAPEPGDPEPAECTVSFFGPGQGGGADQNIERWIGQFEQPDGRRSADLAVIEHGETNGLALTTVEVAGTYLAAMGPGALTGKPRGNYRMLAAIVQGPAGPVFFKLTGPDQTVVVNRDAFERLVRSVRRPS